jgi:segregation and condensation protein A
MFLRGGPEGIETTTASDYQASLYDLLAAYARQRQKQAKSKVTLRQRTVWSLAEAREALERFAGIATQWTALDDYLLRYCVDIQTARTVRASAFSASLEMVREGRFEIRQDRPFAPIWLRRLDAELGREPSGSPEHA